VDGVAGCVAGNRRPDDAKKGRRGGTGSESAVRGLKFADILPIRVATETLAARLADPLGARQIRSIPMIWREQAS
jgi:hypothetical protein